MCELVHFVPSNGSPVGGGGLSLQHDQGCCWFNTRLSNLCLVSRGEQYLANRFSMLRSTSCNVLTSKSYLEYSMG